GGASRRGLLLLDLGRRLSAGRGLRLGREQVDGALPDTRETSSADGLAPDAGCLSLLEVVPADSSGAANAVKDFLTHRGPPVSILTHYKWIRWLRPTNPRAGSASSSPF